MAEFTLSAKIKGVDQASGAMRRVSESVAKVSRGFEGMRNASRKLAIVGAALVAGMGLTLKTAIAQEKAEIQLAAAIRSTGRAIDIDKWKALAASLQDVTGIGDEVTLAAMTMGVRMGLTGEQIEKLTPLVHDFSAAVGMDATQAFMYLGRMITEGTLGQLSRYGVSMQKAQQKAFQTMAENERLAVTLELLERRFGGTAEAVGRDWIGSLDKIKAAWGDTLEDFGAALGRTLKPSLDAVTKKLQELQKLMTLHPQATTNIAKGTAAFAAFALILYPIVNTVASLVSAYAMITVAANTAGVSVGAFIGTMAAGVGVFALWAIAIALLITDIVLIAKNWEDTKLTVKAGFYELLALFSPLAQMTALLTRGPRGLRTLRGGFTELPAPTDAERAAVRRELEGRAEYIQRPTAAKLRESGALPRTTVGFEQEGNTLVLRLDGIGNIDEDQLQEARRDWQELDFAAAAP